LTSMDLSRGALAHRVTDGTLLLLTEAIFLFAFQVLFIYGC